jgi:light-regulated signal transduction histidine kinase (bacteriophytochrome)
LLVDSPGGQRLMPRSSFALWQEKVIGQSMPWQPTEIEMARHLRLSLMEVMASRVENVSRLNRELAVSNAELDAFAYITSHDLREPLRGIYHYAHYLQQHAQKNEDATTLTQTDHLLRLTKRMDGLIESLLHFSRVGRTSLELRPVDMRALVHEAIDILRASRPDKKTVITVAEDLPQAIGDRIRLREVWLNLLTNAVKYNDSETPTITIGARTTQHGLTFFVADDGIGIDPAFHDRIFDMFKRLHGKDKYGGGSGAGLPIVKKIVERHGGIIWLESALGQGTCFYFTLDNDR